jgi:hypothetical protein
MTAGSSTVPTRRFSNAVERRVDVSVLVPAKDEAENLPLFMEQAAAAFAAMRASATRSSSSTTGPSTKAGACCRSSRPATTFCAASSTARVAGSPTRSARDTCTRPGPVLVFYPADLQFKPEDIPRLVAPIIAGDADMVTGSRKGSTRRLRVGDLQSPEPDALPRAR